MTLEAKERETAGEWAWPARLGTWLGQRTLADLVLEAVRKVGGEELNPPVTDPVGSAFHPKAMLAMLASGDRGAHRTGHVHRWDGLGLLKSEMIFMICSDYWFVQATPFASMRTHLHPT